MMPLTPPPPQPPPTPPQPKYVSVSKTGTLQAYMIQPFKGYFTLVGKRKILPIALVTKV